MELGLTLGDSPPPAKAAVAPTVSSAPADGGEDDELVLELGVGAGQLRDVEEKQQGDHKIRDIQPAEEAVKEEEEACPPPGEPPAELIGLRRRLSDPPETGNANLEVCTRGFDVNAAPLSPSSLQMATQVWRADELQEGVEEEEEEKGGGGARKKLRLSKDQSAFLEESFKEHTTPTPKQKSDLAKRLNLRRRQVEVWFQNRRARTKLKQTEVDCEHLKRRCETLAQENRRLHREVAALRASRAATYHPFFYTHLSATTAVSACPACHKLTSAYSPPSVATSGRRRPLG